MAGNLRTPGESVADRIFQILDAFAGERSYLSTADLSRITGIPISTISRHVRALVEWGGLERTRQGYRVGIKLWEISTREPVSDDLRARAMPYLQDLRTLSNAHSGLAVLEGDNALILEKMSTPQAVRSLGRIGGRLPLHSSAMGRVLLANADSAFRERILAYEAPRFTEHTVTEAAAVRNVIARVQREGIAVSDQEITIGVTSIAAPVTGADGAVVAAIGVIVSREPERFTELEDAVRNAAKRFSRSLRSMSPRTPRSVTARD